MTVSDVKATSNLQFGRHLSKLQTATLQTIKRLTSYSIDISLRPSLPKAEHYNGWTKITIFV